MVAGFFCFGFFFPPDSPTTVSTEQQCHCPNCREVALDTSGTVCRIVLKNFSSICSRHRVKNICRTFDLFKRWGKIILIIVDCTVLLIKFWHFGFEGGIQGSAHKCIDAYLEIKHFEVILKVCCALM